MKNTGQKRLKLTLIIAAVVIALVLFVPVPVQWRDGSTEYRALTYTVTHYLRLYEDPVREGYSVVIFGFMVYNDWDKPYQPQ